MKVDNVFSSFSVSDPARAKQFYGETLGFEIKDQPMGFLEIVVPGGTHVTAYPKDNHEPATFTILNLIVPSVEDAVDELNAKGITMEQYHMTFIETDAKGIARDESGPAIAWFKDPFGNILSVVENRPGMAESSAG
jgi:catechol 2,3-dioxygenase-like lactoylglutathione lyase family enzyme